jgi:GTP-binding protein
MKITSATFVTGLVGTSTKINPEIPQVAFVGRSNAGKSSLLNSLTRSKKLAVTSKTPGRTKEINVFLINGTHYFMDLPGYGYAKTGLKTLEKLSSLIYWYLFESPYDPTVVLLIDSVVGPTDDDLGMLQMLEEAGKPIVIVANKVDKIKKSQLQNRMNELRDTFNGHRFVPYSSKAKVGIDELTRELLLH